MREKPSQGWCLLENHYTQIPPKGLLRSNHRIIKIPEVMDASVLVIEFWKLRFVCDLLLSCLVASRCNMPLKRQKPRMRKSFGFSGLSIILVM